MSGVSEMLEQMREQRSRINERLQSVSEEQMLAPTTYGQREVSVRFMFYRLIAHEVEHTVHLIKTLGALGIAQGESGLILKSLQAARGELEGMLIGLSDEDLDRAPGPEDWPVRRVLEHIMETEESYSRRIENGIAAESASG